MKLKMKYMKLKYGKKKLNEKTWSIYGGEINIDETGMDQSNYQKTWYNLIPNPNQEQ